MLALLVVGILAVVAFYLRSRRTPKLTDKDTVVLSEFDNRTGDPIFDGTLKPALAIDLEQTPFLSLLPDQRVRSTLKLMNRREGERITRDTALEICQRADSKSVIAGSIVSVGEEYVINLEVLDCRDNGAVIASQQARSRGKEAVLDALDQPAAALRRDLGESLASIRKFDAPLRQATTPSLEALKAFNAGAELERHGPNQSAAIPFFLHAIELDPNFALAYAYLGLSYMNIGEAQRARPCFEKAYVLRDRVSEREKLLLTSFYQSDALGDIDKEMETYRIWMEEYPRDWIPVDGLAERLTSNFNEYEQAARLFSHAMQLDPQQPYSPAGLAQSYLALGRTQDAKAVLDEAFAIGLENTAVRSVLYQVAIVQGDAVAETAHAALADAWRQQTTSAQCSHSPLRNADGWKKPATSSSVMCKSCTLPDGMRLPQSNLPNSLCLRRTFCIPVCVAMQMPVLLWHVKPILRRYRLHLPWQGILRGPRPSQTKSSDPRGSVPTTEGSRFRVFEPRSPSVKTISMKLFHRLSRCGATISALRWDFSPSIFEGSRFSASGIPRKQPPNSRPSLIIVALRPTAQIGHWHTLGWRALAS